MQIRLPDSNLINIEPTINGAPPDGPLPQYIMPGFHTWLKINDGMWRLIVRADFAALLMDVAKEAKTLVEYEAYLKANWSEYQCDTGMVIKGPQLIDTPFVYSPYYTS